MPKKVSKFEVVTLAPYVTVLADPKAALEVVPLTGGAVEFHSNPEKIAIIKLPLVVMPPIVTELNSEVMLYPTKVARTGLFGTAA
jgi:hypothetical protein